MKLEIRAITSNKKGSFEEIDSFNSKLLLENIKEEKLNITNEFFLTINGKYFEEVLSSLLKRNSKNFSLLLTLRNNMASPLTEEEIRKKAMDLAKRVEWIGEMDDLYTPEAVGIYLKNNTLFMFSKKPLSQPIKEIEKNIIVSICSEFLLSAKDSYKINGEGKVWLVPMNYIYYNIMHLTPAFLDKKTANSLLVSLIFREFPIVESLKENIREALENVEIRESMDIKERIKEYLKAFNPFLLTDYKGYFFDIIYMLESLKREFDQLINLNRKELKNTPVLIFNTSGVGVLKKGNAKISVESLYRDETSSVCDIRIIK